MKQVGIVGVGDMGMGIAKNLIGGDFKVIGFDMNETRLNNFADAGGTKVKDVKSVGIDSDIVFVMVLNEAQSKAVVLGENGLIATMKPHSTVIITATIGVQGVQDIADELAKKDINMIDCPVSGGRTGANGGTLTLMASGKKDVFESCSDVFNAIAKNIYFIGENIGDGQGVKACLMAYMGTSYIACFEALALGAAMGLDPEKVTEVITNSYVGSPLFEITANYIMDRKFIDTGSHIRTITKDVGISMDIAKKFGVPMPCCAITDEMFRAGINKFPAEDNWCVIKLLESISGEQCKRANK